MKTKPICNHSTLKKLAILAVALGVAWTSSVQADVIFDTDFSKDTFEALGWDAKGDWTMADYGAAKPDLEKNPGPVAKFAANGTSTGALTKKFTAVTNPSSLTLTFDAGYGWGAPDHAQGIQVMILDADGNGYIFAGARTKANWAAQWAKVTKYGYNNPMNWAPGVVDASQPAVRDGGGLRTFTITRDAAGNWTFNGAGWTGGPITFTDASISTFSQVVLCGTPNNDEILYNKIKLDAAK